MLENNRVHYDFVTALNQSRDTVIETREQLGFGRRTEFLIAQLAPGEHRSKRIERDMKVNLFQLILQTFGKRRFA